MVRWVPLLALAAAFLFAPSDIVWASDSVGDPALQRAVKGAADLPAQLEAVAPAVGNCGKKVSSVCNESFGPVLATDSPSLEYFKALLQRGKAAPLDDFMRLWYPDRKPANDSESNSQACFDGGTCGPLDTAYSWGSAAKLAALQQTLPDRGSWTGDPNPGHMLDTVFSAIGTYAYGPIQVRMKLKSGNGAPFHSEEILGAEQIESWSFGTPEQYDEIVRDYLRYKSGKPWVGYWALNTKCALSSCTPDTATGKDELFRPGLSLDGHIFSEDVLKDAFLQMIQMIVNGEGRIYYSRGACRNRQNEFSTTFPTYVDPFRASQSARRSAD